MNCRRNSGGPNNERLAIARDGCRAFRPHHFDLPQPVVNLAAEESVLGVVGRPQLLVEAAGTKEWYPGLGPGHSPTPPDQPDVKVQSPRSMSKANDGFPLHRNSVLVDLLVERLAESDGVSARRWDCIIHFEIRIEPESQLVKEVETRGVKKRASVRGFLGSDENSGGKYSFKPCNQSAIVRTVFGQPKELEQLSCGIEVYCSGLLLDGECSNPDRNEPVLAEGQAVIRMCRMCRNVEEKIAAVPGVYEL